MPAWWVTQDQERASPAVDGTAKHLVYADAEVQFLDHWDAICQTPEAKEYEKHTR